MDGDAYEDDDLAPDPRRARRQRLIAALVLAGLSIPLLIGLVELVMPASDGPPEPGGFQPLGGDVVPYLLFERIMPEPSAGEALGAYTPERMARLHRGEGFTFVAGDVASSDPSVVSVHALARSWSAAALGPDGSCVLILMQQHGDGQITVSRDTLRDGEPCRGAYAVAERMPPGSAW